ncbi:MAG: lipoyl synthase, partial [Bacteroidales bacterium]|nr:lipoyl synthase [Bacteroidales bacterium]
MQNYVLRKPEWLRVKIPQGTVAANVQRTVRQQQLHTVCDSGLCPNRAEC